GAADRGSGETAATGDPSGGDDEGQGGDRCFDHADSSAARAGAADQTRRHRQGARRPAQRNERIARSQGEITAYIAARGGRRSEGRRLFLFNKCDLAARAKYWSSQAQSRDPVLLPYSFHGGSLDCTWD